MAVEAGSAASGDAESARDYGRSIAPLYDSWYPNPQDAGEAVAFLAGLVPGGRALELGIGSGRVALPLAGAGLMVEGIEASQEMVDLLRAKPGGTAIPVHIGDFAEVAVDHEFDLVFAVWTTFFMLPSQEAQLRCLENVRERLGESGRLVLQVFQSGLVELLARGVQRVSVAEDDRLLVELGNHDPVGQSIRMQRLAIAGERVSLHPVHLRYAWPAEMDALALAAGLRRVERYGDWDRRAFMWDSPWNLSVYARR